MTKAEPPRRTYIVAGTLREAGRIAQGLPDWSYVFDARMIEGQPVDTPVWVSPTFWQREDAPEIAEALRELRPRRVDACA